MIIHNKKIIFFIFLGESSELKTIVGMKKIFKNIW